MARLHIGHPLTETSSSDVRVSAGFRLGFREKTVWFRTSPGPVSGRSDPFVPVALIPAMRRGWRLTMAGSVSERLLRGAAEIQDTLTGWYPEYRRVRIECTAVPPPAAPAGRPIAAFFSGGIDSFYTLLRHRDEITDLVFVHGFDVPLWRETERQRAAASVRALARREGLAFVEVETNLRQFGEPYVNWMDACCGAALGAVALLLAPRYDRIYIPASVGADELEPMGSHPALDPHWTGGDAEVVHDGLEATRFDKVLAIADWPAVHSHLRVCYRNNTAHLNCGQCRKCVWTLALLEAAGCMDRVSTFDTKLERRLLRLYPPTHKYQRDRFVRALALLERRGANPALQEALRDMLEAGTRASPGASMRLLLARAHMHLDHLLPAGG